MRRNGAPKIFSPEQENTSSGDPSLQVQNRATKLYVPLTFFFSKSHRASTQHPPRNIHQDPNEQCPPQPVSNLATVRQYNIPFNPRNRGHTTPYYFPWWQEVTCTTVTKSRNCFKNVKMKNNVKIPRIKVRFVRLLSNFQHFVKTIWMLSTVSPIMNEKESWWCLFCAAELLVPLILYSLYTLLFMVSRAYRGNSKILLKLGHFEHLIGYWRRLYS